MGDAVAAEVIELLDRALATSQDPPGRERLLDARRRLGEPLRLAVAGMVKSGKSTLVNALLGEELALTDAGECTTIVTWYRYGDSPGVTIHPIDRPPEPARFTCDAGPVVIDLGDRSPAEIDHLEIRWPTRRLVDLTIIDTPGIESISAEVSAQTHRVLSAEGDDDPIADAVLYLMRHAHASDVRFLEAFHDDEQAHGTAINSVGVLSRADEIGSARLDAMEDAARIARRYESDERIRRLCPIVVPVDCLLGHGARTLHDGEFRLLAALAREPRVEREDMLVTVDRFRTRTSTVTELEREHLLDRFGLFGIRLAIELIDSGTARTSTRLAQEFDNHSGLSELRSVLTRQFHERSQILRARSAMSVLGSVLSAEPSTATTELLGAVERLRSRTHEFEEVRVLSALRNGLLGLTELQLTELERLLGGRGHDRATRLGLPRDSRPDQAREAAVEALTRWQALAEHPLSDRGVRHAARTATRTLEGVLSRSGN